MSSKFKRMDREGYHRLVAVVAGKIHWLYRMARLGDRHDTRGSSRVD